VSDGLLQDLGHLCDASRVGARVEAARLPRPGASAAARAGRDPLELACGGGEDYELLFSAPPRRAGAVAAAAARAGTTVTHIGTLVRGGGVRLLDERGRTHTVRLRGHDHLR